MPRTTDPARPTDATRFRAAVRSGDASAFALLAERYRADLVVHCARIVGTEQAARYVTQEVLLRAWHRRATFPTPASLRSWLCRIATTVCLDHLARQHHAHGAGAWADPGAPDEGLARETVELAVLVALQHLPIPQRAALVLHDILGWSAVDTAITLETSAAAVDRALQLARVRMREHLPDDRVHWQPRRRSMDRTDIVRALFTSFVAQDRAAAEALVGDPFVFSSPQDDHIDRPTWFTRCFPTAGHFRRHELLHVAPAGGDDVFVLYEYELHTGEVFRNTEVLTVRDDRVVETQVFFGARQR